MGTTISFRLPLAMCSQSPMGASCSWLANSESPRAPRGTVGNGGQQCSPATFCCTWHTGTSSAWARALLLLQEEQTPFQSRNSEAHQTKHASSTLGAVPCARGLPAGSWHGAACSPCSNYCSFSFFVYRTALKIFPFPDAFPCSAFLRRRCQTQCHPVHCAAFGN